LLAVQHVIFGLLGTLARQLQEGFVKDIDDRPRGLERLLALVDGHLAPLADPNETLRAFLVLWREAAMSAELAPTFRERDSAFRDDIAAEVSAGIAMQSQLDPAAVDAEQLRSEVAGQWRRALSPGR
jgi:AcrR family transcriptional regulator